MQFLHHVKRGRIKRHAAVFLSDTGQFHYAARQGLSAPFPSDAEATQAAERAPPAPRNPRTPKPTGTPPEGLAAGGLTMSDAVLPVFDSKRKQRGYVKKVDGGYLAVGRTTIGRYRSQGEAAYAVDAEARREDAECRAERRPHRNPPRPKPTPQRAPSLPFGAPEDGQ